MKTTLIVIALAAGAAFLVPAAPAQQIQTQQQRNRNVNNFNPVNFNSFTPTVTNFNAVDASSKSTSQAASKSKSSAVATGGNAAASTGPVSVNASSTTINPDVITNLDYVAWKRFQLFERPLARTTPGATISPYDTRAVVATQAPTPSPDPAIERYNKFLKAKGIQSNTIGAATVVNGKMEVPLTK